MRNSRLKKHARRDRARRSFRPSIERLEDRRVLAVSIAPIQAWAYVDLNNDGYPQVGEPPIEGVSIRMQTSGGGDFSLQTDSQGRAWFGGNWTVETTRLTVTTPEGYSNVRALRKTVPSVYGGSTQFDVDFIEFVNANYRADYIVQNWSYSVYDFAGTSEGFYFGFRGGTDIAPTSFEFSPTGAEFKYEVKGGDVPSSDNPKVELYWASGRTYEDRLGTALFSEAVTKSVGTHGPIAATIDFDSKPVSATHLIVVTDPTGETSETDEEHNVKSLPLIDIDATAFDWESNGSGVFYKYSIRGVPENNAQIAVYWASGNQLSDRKGEAVFVKPLESAKGDYGPLHIDSTQLGEPPAGVTHLLLVVDSDEAVEEYNEKNNLLDLRLPNIKALADSNVASGPFHWNSLENGGGFTFSYDIDNPDHAPIPDIKIDFYWDAIGGGAVHSFDIDDVGTDEDGHPLKDPGIHTVTIRHDELNGDKVSPPLYSSAKLVMRIDSENHTIESAKDDNIVNIEVVPLVVTVATHGWNSTGSSIPWPSYQTEFDTLPEAGSILDGRVATYVPTWDSNSFFTPALGALAASLAAPEYVMRSAFELAARALSARAAGYALDAANIIAAHITDSLLLSPKYSNQLQRIQLIGHSRGAAVNTFVSQILARNFDNVVSFVSIDGFATDWPDSAGLIGDTSITSAVVESGGEKLNYRVERGLGAAGLGYVLDPILDFLAGEIGIPFISEAEIPLVATAVASAWLDLRAPDRAAAGFKDQFVFGPNGPSNHGNADDLFISNPFFFENNYEGRNKGMGAFAGELPLAVNRHEDSGRSIQSELIPAATLDSASTGIGFIDGTFDLLGTAWSAAQSASGAPTGDKLVDYWQGVLADASAILNTIWSTNGDVQLVQQSASVAAQLSDASGNASLSQFVVLPDRAATLQFDLAVSAVNPGDILTISYRGNVLSTFELSTLSPLNRVTLPLANLPPSGDFAFDLSSSDGALTSIFIDNIAIFTDVVANVPPMAVDDVVSMPFGGTISIAVLFNDSDADGALNPASIVVVTPPAHGTTVIDGVLGTILYTPSPGFSGIDTLQYRVSDKQGAESNLATVSIMAPQHQPPLAVGDLVVTERNTAILIDVLLNDTHSDGVLDPTTVAIVLPPANGAVTVDPVTGVVTYTPNAGYIGADSFTYQVSDDLGAASNEATVTIAVQATNVAPVASNDSVTVYKNVPLLINVLSNDSDSDGSLDPATVAIVGAPQHGTLSINAATGEIEYAPVTDYTGNDQFTYTVQDDTGAISNTATVFVAVNAPPVANDDSATATTNSPKQIIVLSNDADADGALNPASVTIVSPPSSGAVTVDPITGAVTYQSAAGFTGSDSFQYQVLDNVAALSNTATVTITVAANQAPVAQNDNAITLIDSAVLIKLLVNDADADGNLAVASVAITQQPTSGAVTVDANGVATYTPNLGFQGVDQFSYTVSDQAGIVSNVAQARVRVIPAAEFTTLSPTIGGVLPSGVTAIGGMVLDLVGLNGVRVVSQLAASQLYVGYFDSGTPTSFQGNPGTIGVQSGFSAAILQALGGGLSEVAVRVTLFDGDTGPSNFDDGDQNYLLLNGVNLGDFSDVMTQQRSSDGVQVLSNNAVGGFRNEILDTGFFYSNQRQVLDAFFATLSHGSVSYQLQDDDPFDNFFDFTQGIDGGLINVGQGPNVAPSATDDAATTNANTPVTIDVLQNDSDADGTLDVSEVVVVDLPSHGTTSVDPATGRITYTPIQGYAGPDSFTYRVKDNTGTDSNVATVSVTVAAGSSLLPFRDDFNRSDNGDLGPAWTERYGDLKIRANELSPTDKDTAIATVDDVLLTDVIVSADVDITRNDKVVGKVGILARYSGPGDKNYYMARLTQNGDNFAAQIYRNVNGAFTRLSTANVPGGAGTLKFVVVGSTLKLYFNGAIVGDVQDTALSDPGMVGVRHAGGYLDNMFVDAATNIAPPVPPDVPEFSDSFNRASDTNLGAGWTEHVGDVAISNNRVRPTGGNPSLATAQNFAAADVSLSAFVEAHSTGDVGIVARYSGPGDQNYYLARVTQTGGKYLAQIYRNLGGVWAQLSSALLSSNQGTLRFDLSGPSLRLYFNGQIMGNVVDSALSGAGLVGLRMTSGSMDSFSATKLVITAPTPTQVLFSDDFNRGDSTQLGSSWTEKTGNAKTDNTHLAVVNGAQSIVTVNGMEPTDVSLAADVNMSSESKIGLIARYAGPGEANFYMGRLTINGSQVTAQIYSNVNGTFTRLTSTPVPGGTGSLRFDVVGTSLKLYFNGQLVGDAQDTSISGPGLVGVRSSGGTVDNFVVRSPSSSIPTSSPAFGDSFERPNGSALGPSWLERIGDLKIDGNRLAVASASLSLATVQGLSHVDISLSADVNLSATSKIGLVARYAGPADANYYLARLSVIAGQVTAEIYRNLAGTLTLLSSSPVSGGTGTLRFDVLGSVLKLYYKGQLISEVQDNSLSSPGLVGVQMDGGIVDSFNAVRL